MARRLETRPITHLVFAGYALSCLLSAAACGSPSNQPLNACPGLLCRAHTGAGGMNSEEGATHGGAGGIAAASGGASSASGSNTGTGNSTTGGATFAGNPGSFGGTHNGSAGNPSSAPRGGSPSTGAGSSSGVSTTAGGSPSGAASAGRSGNGAVAGASANGGATSSAGSPSVGGALNGPGASGSVGTGVGPSSNCQPEVGRASELALYQRQSAVCTLSLDAPRSGVWRAFDDATEATPNATISVLNASVRSSSCSISGNGRGAMVWGGGVGFTFSGGETPCPFDASAYRGLQFSIRGNLLAAEGPNYVATSNLVRVNVVTTATSDEYGSCTAAQGKCNDHFGVWCSVGPSSIRCNVPFDSLSQQGWGAIENFNRAQLIQIQILALRYTAAPMATTWNLTVDGVAFYL